MNRFSPEPEHGDYAWSVSLLGDALADALWPHLQWAENERLVRVYGYPKDNADPPPLCVRLEDQRFVRAILKSLHTSTEEDPEERDSLQEALKILSSHNPQLR